LALSSNQGYQVTAINTLTFDPWAFILIAGKPHFLQVSLISATGTDKRDHSYFVYSPLEISGAKLLENKTRIWIQYTFNNNHTPANNLSKAEKAKAWAEQREDIFVKPR
jgi:hypothetical protein